MQSLALIGYKLMYIQIPYLISFIPVKDIRGLSWSDVDPVFGLYQYDDSLIGQFRSHKYFTRSILGEDDIFLLSGEVEDYRIPYSFLRMVSGDYRFINFHFQRRLESLETSGGFWGLHSYGNEFKGYGNISMPFKIDGFDANISFSVYSDIWDISFNTDYFYLGTTMDVWLAYLKIGDLRFGSSSEIQFGTYLMRIIDPIFLLLFNVSGEGLIDNKDWNLRDWSISPIYVLNLESSIYCVISKNPCFGLKTKFADVELGETSYLSLKTDFLKTFLTYSLEDSLPRGGIGGEVSYSFYNDKISPGAGASYHDSELDVQVNLRILETHLFVGMNDAPYGEPYWGINIDFTF